MVSLFPDQFILALFKVTSVRLVTENEYVNQNGSSGSSAEPKLVSFLKKIFIFTGRSYMKYTHVLHAPILQSSEQVHFCLMLSTHKSDALLKTGSLYNSIPGI